ncbi:MAG: type IV pilin protein [Motilibacteraceae bacterium]
MLTIVGVLSAIAIPVFLNQRAKARDASTKADVNTLAKEVATYFVDGGGTVLLDFDTSPGKALLSDGSGWVAMVNLTNGTVAPTSGAGSNLGSPDTWCVSLTDPKGRDKTFKYEAQNGLGLGSCA